MRSNTQTQQEYFFFFVSAENCPSLKICDQRSVTRSPLLFFFRMHTTTPVTNERDNYWMFWVWKAQFSSDQCPIHTQKCVPVANARPTSEPGKQNKSKPHKRKQITNVFIKHSEQLSVEPRASTGTKITLKRKPNKPADFFFNVPIAQKPDTEYRYRLGKWAVSQRLCVWYAEHDWNGGV